MSAAQRLDEVFGLPRGSAVIVLNDPETKVPIAIMDGTLISAIRTGAVTGVCAKYMAPSRSKTVGLFGAGPQCKTQLMALKASLPQLEKAYVYDLSRERAEKFAAEMSQKLNMDVQAASDRLATIESGDILVTATTATEPIIHGAEIKKGRLRCSPWQQRGRRGADPARGQGRHRRLGDRQAPHGRHDGLHVPRRQDRRFRH